MSSLNDVLNITLGKFINLKNFQTGETIVHKNGTKTYNKDIPTNLPYEDCILITAMSIDILKIKKEDTVKHYASQGCFILTLKSHITDFTLDYLYYYIKLGGATDELKKARMGSLQQFINKGRLEDVLKKDIVYLTVYVPI